MYTLSVECLCVCVDSYKIDPDFRVTWHHARACITLTIWNQILYILPITVAQCIWTPNAVLPKQAPPLFEFLWQQYVALVIFVFLFYVWHVVHHRVPFLYKYVRGVFIQNSHSAE